MHVFYDLISKGSYHHIFSACKMGFMVSQNDVLMIVWQPSEGNRNILLILDDRKLSILSDDGVLFLC